MSEEDVLAAPIQTRWQTLPAARGKRAAAAISAHADKLIFGDDFFKALVDRYWKVESESRWASLYSVLFLFVLFIARYAPIAEITWVGIKVTELKGFSEVLLFISSITAIYTCFLNVANHMRKHIIVEFAKLRAGSDATTLSTAYIDDDLIAESLKRAPNELWSGLPGLAIVGFTVGIAVFALGLAGLLSLMRLIVIFDIAGEVRLPAILHYMVLVTAVGALVFGILAVILVYCPWPYTDYTNSDAFYALKEKDPEKFSRIFFDFSQRRSNQEVLHDRITSAFVFFLGFFSLQFLFRDMDTFLSASVVIKFIGVICITAFVGGATITALNRKITHILYSPGAGDEAENLRRYKLSKRLAMIVTVVVPAAFVVLFFFLPAFSFS